MKERKRNPTNKKENVGLTYKDKKDNSKTSSIVLFSLFTR